MELAGRPVPVNRTPAKQPAFTGGKVLIKEGPPSPSDPPPRFLGPPVPVAPGGMPGHVLEPRKGIPERRPANLSFWQEILALLQGRR